jgi:phosphoglycerate dehydrogenase-like enzyme
MRKVAVLDDYQGVALTMADWSVLGPECRVEAFRDHLTDLDALADRLRDFEIVTCMRERTPFGRDLLERLPNLRLLVTTSMRNAAIDVVAAKEPGAGLDVFDQEPLPADHPFKKLDNTLLMPHAGYVTEAQYRVRYRDTVEDVAAYLRGAPLRTHDSK